MTSFFISTPMYLYIRSPVGPRHVVIFTPKSPEGDLGPLQIMSEPE